MASASYNMDPAIGNHRCGRKQLRMIFMVNIGVFAIIALVVTWLQCTQLQNRTKEDNEENSTEWSWTSTKAATEENWTSMEESIEGSWTLTEDLANGSTIMTSTPTLREEGWNTTTEVMMTTEAESRSEDEVWNTTVSTEMFAAGDVSKHTTPMKLDVGVTTEGSPKQETIVTETMVIMIDVDNETRNGSMEVEIPASFTTTQESLVEYGDAGMDTGAAENATATPSDTMGTSQATTRTSPTGSTVINSPHIEVTSNINTIEDDFFFPPNSDVKPSKITPSMSEVELIDYYDSMREPFYARLIEGQPAWEENDVDGDLIEMV